jgi:transposase
MNTALAVGLDLHRKFSQASLQQELPDGEIRVMERKRLDHLDRPAMEAWLKKLPAGTPVAMEGAFGWPWVADLLARLGLDPHLGHPPAIKVLAKNEAKGDRVDADRLARFWLRGIFPESYLSTPEVRQLRERLRHRMGLVHVRSLTKNRIQALLHRAGIFHTWSDLFGKGGREFLDTLTLPAGARTVLDDNLRLIGLLTERIEAIESWMIAQLKEDEIVRLLASIPGIGLVLAHVIRAEIGQLTERFASAKRLTSYAGLAPLSDDSADRHGRRHIVAQACNHTLRWALIEAAAAALHSRRCPPKFRKLHDRLTNGGRVNKNQGRVAVARELCELVYVIWKKGEPYREAEPPSPRARRPRIAAR